MPVAPLVVVASLLLLLLALPLNPVAIAVPVAISVVVPIPVTVAIVVPIPVRVLVVAPVAVGRIETVVLVVASVVHLTHAVITLELQAGHVQLDFKILDSAPVTASLGFIEMLFNSLNISLRLGLGGGAKVERCNYRSGK